jgi:Transposase DDE domain
MARFPPGKGGGEGLAYGRKGKGLRIHRLTDAPGRPLSAYTTPTNGDERAQVLPLRDAVHVRTGRQGRPRKRRRSLAAEQGDDAKALRRRLRARGLRPPIPKRVWKGHQPRGRPLQKAIPRDQAERTFAWFHRKYRRLVVRWERLAACFKAFLALAMVHMWVHKIIVG